MNDCFWVTLLIKWFQFKSGILCVVATVFMKLADFFGVRSLLGDDIFTAYNPNFSLVPKIKKIESQQNRQKIIRKMFLRESLAPFKVVNYRPNCEKRNNYEIKMNNIVNVRNYRFRSKSPEYAFKLTWSFKTASKTCSRWLCKYSIRSSSTKPPLSDQPL